MSRSSARRALAAVIVAAATSVVAVAPASALPTDNGRPSSQEIRAAVVAGYQRATAPPTSSSPVGDRPADRPSSSTARYQTPDVTEVTASGDVTPAGGRARPVGSTRVAVGDRPADRPSSSTARFSTADLAASGTGAARGSEAPDALPLLIGGVAGVIALSLFGAYRLRPRPGRAPARG